MSRFRTLITAGVAAAVTFVVLTSMGGVQAQDTAAREARDRAEIDALMWRYVRALDTLNADAYAANYTPDGRFGNTKGHEALKKMITDLVQQRTAAAAKGEPPRPAMYHVITNPYVEFVDPDHAVYRSYWMTVFGAAGQNMPPRVAAAGRGLDRLVRVNGKWLIQSREVTPTDE